MKKEYWNLVKEIAERVGNREVVEQCEEHQRAINEKQEKLENQLKTLANL